MSETGMRTAFSLIAQSMSTKLVFDVNGSYFWAKDDLDIWNVGGGIAYAVRLMRDHVNVIPRFGMAYNKAMLGSSSADATTINPGLTLSYAINNRVSVNANYTYVRDIDFDKHSDAHTYGGGARVALTERLGLDLGASFAEGEGFVGAFAGRVSAFLSGPPAREPPA